MVGMRLTENALGLCSTIILVRLLTPADFGLVAMASSAYVLLMLLGQFGFETALVQKKAPERTHYDTAWTCNILLGLLVALALSLLAKPAALFFRDARIEQIMYCFSLLSLARGFENIGVVDFRRNLTFGKEYFYFVVPKMTSLVIGVLATFILRSYWGLVIGMTSHRIARLIYSYAAQRYRPRLSLAEFSDLFGFSRWIVGKNFLEYLSLQGIDVILGRVLGATAVGFYSIAHQIAFIPSSEILAPVNRAIFPSFSRMADDTARLRWNAYRVYAMTALLSIPAAFGIWAVSDVLVPVVFGDNWLGVAPLLSVLAFAGTLSATMSLGQTILFARGTPRTFVYSLVVYVAVLIPATIVLIRIRGPVGVGYAMLIASAVALPMLYVAVRKEIRIRASVLLAYSWRPLLGAGVMALAVRWTEGMLIGDGAEPTVVVLLALVGAGVVSYAGVIFLLWLASRRPEGPEQTLHDFVRSRFARARRAA